LILTHLEELLEKAAFQAKNKRKISFKELPDVFLEVPKESFGDWSSNLPFLLASQASLSPRQVGEVLIEEMDSSPWVERVELGGAGFINFYLSPSYVFQELLEILKKKSDYGSFNFGSGKKIQIEFVSANPVGPLHLGHGRWAAVGDTLANLFEKTGHEVIREFYLNDYGTQMDIFARSVEARYAELVGEKVDFPEDGYRGKYIYKIAEEIKESEGERLLELREEERRTLFKDLAYERALRDIKKTLEKMEVRFDVWFKESQLHQSGEIERTIELLRKKGVVYEKDKAIWLQTSKFGDDKDRVLIRETGEPTYFAADIAYHCNKHERGFDQVINVWGADHHGYVSRVKAALKALGYSEEFLEVLIGQMVNLLMGGKPVRMSKRTGEMVTLEELLGEVGKDPLRYFFVSRGIDAPLDFDIELVKKESSENPVYYIQYAHARISSLFRKAAEQEIKISKVPVESLKALKSSEEASLAKKLFLFPYVIEKAVKARAPYRLTNYLYDLACAFHVFYTECRILGEEKEVEEARLLLTQATQIVIFEGLRLLGVSAPERM
jgi:arginyl-tRNA synthetase